NERDENIVSSVIRMPIILYVIWTDSYTSLLIFLFFSSLPSRFGMNFAYGRDIILHFNPRFHYRKIVLNSCQSGKWGKEESSKLPFQKGEHFEAVFIVSETEYQVDIRDRGSFGTCNLDSCLFQPVPYRGDIPGGLGTNRTITVRGFIPNNATRFQINLIVGKNIALHLDSHMKPQRYLVHNYLNGKWGTKKNDLPFNPFQLGQYFEVSWVIPVGRSINREEFKVYTSGCYLFNFAHHYALTRLTQTR
uniref:Galectin n=1 Tax=Laticauda laticaudata TaxID=8630 RepID=A0A8C5RNU7_LATLA